MHRVRGSRMRFVKDVVSLLRSGQCSREVPSPSVPSRVRSAPSRGILFWSVQVRTRMRCRLPDRRASRTSRKCRCNFWIPRNQKLAAYGGFFREEKIILLEARSILYAVRHAESSYLPGRLQTFSDNLALVPALCKGCSLFRTLLSVTRQIYASGFRAGFALSFRWMPSELNYSDKGSRFLDRDLTRANHFFLLWHSAYTRSSPARTSDQDCFPPSLSYLDVGEVDLTSHVHVPAVSVQSHVSRDVLSSCTRDAAAVSSLTSSVTGKNDCISGLMSHGSCAPLTFFELPPGLFGSQFLDESQMQWSSSDTGTEVCHARSRTKVCEKYQITRLLAPPPDAKRPSRVSPCQRSVIRCPTPVAVSCLKNVVVSNWQAKLRKSKARPLAKRRTAKPATKTGHFLCRSPHGWFLDDDTTVCACWSII